VGVCCVFLVGGGGGGGVLWGFWVLVLSFFGKGGKRGGGLCLRVGVGCKLTLSIALSIFRRNWDNNAGRRRGGDVEGM